MTTKKILFNEDEMSREIKVARDMGVRSERQRILQILDKWFNGRKIMEEK